MESQELKRIVEALIFAADEPLSAGRILETLELQNGFELNAIIDELNREYQDSGRAFTIRQVAGGYQIATQPNYASWIKKLYLGRQKTRLSQAALETLALIAFKQPISRVEIAQIRGVNSDGVIGTLLERKLITISGRAEAVGRPLLYSTTPEFLKYFGLNDLSDLPKPREIEELFSKEGMPEELLHVLSQEDPQLSLPINAENEATAAPDDLEGKTAITEPPISPQLPLASVALDNPSATPAGAVSETAAHSKNPAEPSEAFAAVPESEVVPIDINDAVVTLLDDFDASTPSRDESTSDLAPQTAIDANAITTLDVAGDLPASTDRAAESEPALAILSLIPPAQQTDREEISPETLAAGVEELFKNSPASPFEDTQGVEVSEVGEIDDIPAIWLDETSPTPTSLFSSVSDDPFATTNEIVLMDETPGLPPASAEEPNVVITVPASFESTADVFLATLQSIDQEDAPDDTDDKLFETGNSVATRESDPVSEVDGWLAEEFAREEIAEPDFLLKTNNAIPKDKSTTDATLDALSLALPDFPKLIGLETPLAESLPAAAAALSETVLSTPAEESPPTQFVTTAVVELFESAAAMSANNPVPNPPLPAATFEGSPGESGVDVRIAASEPKRELAELEMPSQRWANLRERATGWIKRAVAKLMALVGRRFD